jgi:hypothetical protein
MRGQPDLYESVEAAEKREALERHEAFVRAFGDAADDSETTCPRSATCATLSRT